MKMVLAAAGVAILAAMLAVPAHAEGNLAAKATELELNINTVDLNFSQTEFQIETGKYYILHITSDGEEEIAVVAPELWRNSWINQVVVNDLEIDALRASTASSSTTKARSTSASCRSGRASTTSTCRATKTAASKGSSSSNDKPPPIAARGRTRRRGDAPAPSGLCGGYGQHLRLDREGQRGRCARQDLRRDQAHRDQQAAARHALQRRTGRCSSSPAATTT